MITDFDDLCLWTYVIVDDMLIELAPLLRRPGPPPPCGDSELITMILVAECKGWDIETQLLSEFSPAPPSVPYTALSVPTQPAQTPLGGNHQSDSTDALVRH